MATLPDPRTQVLPDGASFPSKRFLKPLSLQDGSHRRDALGSYFAPYGEMFGDEPPDGEAVMNEVTSPSVVHEDRNPLHKSP